MKASDVIREARNVLFERGWGRNDLESDDGSVCMRGALAVALSGDPWMDNLPNDIELAMAQACGTDLYATFFNDQPSTSFSDVVDAFDRAEKIAEQREADDA